MIRKPIHRLSLAALFASALFLAFLDISAKQAAARVVFQGQAAPVKTPDGAIPPEAILPAPDTEPVKAPSKPVGEGVCEGDKFDNCLIYLERNDWVRHLSDYPSEVRVMMLAIATQESNLSCGAVNPHSEALGFAQVMPFNLPSWTGLDLPMEELMDKFLTDCELQVRTVAAKIQEYFDGIRGEWHGTSMWTSSTCPRLERDLKTDPGKVYEAISSTWYSGDPCLIYSTRTQYYNGHPYPSIADYSMSVRGYVEEIAANEREFIRTLPPATDFSAMSYLGTQIRRLSI